MAVPKKRQSHGRTHERRAHDALSALHLYNCPRCGTARRPHTICANCGVYATRGRERVVVDVEAADETE